MICGNPTCKYEFCWLCLQESTPDHYEFGPCAGKQFEDTESILYGHPCLEKLFNVLMIIVFIILIILVITFPVITFSMNFFL